MSLAQIYVLGILLVALIQIVRNHWRIDVAGLFMLVALASGQQFGLPLLPPVPAAGQQPALAAFSGFTQPMIFTIIGLLILTRSLEHQGILNWLAARVSGIGGGSIFRLILLFAGLAVLLSQFMNNFTVVALLLPVALQTTVQADIPPSKILLPIAFGALLGGMSTYFTTVNIVMSDLLASASPPQMPLGFLAFLPTGGLIALLGLVYLATTAPRLLPERQPSSLQQFSRQTRQQMAERYHLDERLWEARILPGSPLAGSTLGKAHLGDGLGVSIAAIWRGHQALLDLTADLPLQADDILLVIGNNERIRQLKDWGCEINRGQNGHNDPEGLVLVEVMPSPDDETLLGKTLRELNLRRRTGFTAVALQRGGQTHRTDVGFFPLQPGDTLLLVGPRKHLAELHADPSWLILNEAAPSPKLGWKSALSLALFAVLVALSVAGWPVYLSAMTLALFSLLLRLAPPEGMHRSINWRVIFFLAGMYAVGQGLLYTGLVGQVSAIIVRALPHPSALTLAGTGFWLAVLLTQFLGSQTTAFVIGPMLIQAAIQIGLPAQPIALATAIGCSTAFLTPMAHPVNLIMATPAGYRFSDYARLGLGLTLLVFLGLLAGLRLFWGI